MSATPSAIAAVPAITELSVYTQNMQGGCNMGYVKPAILHHDICVFQECGSPGFLGHATSVATAFPGVTTGTINFGTTYRPAIYCYVFHNNGNRCSQIVVLREDLCGGAPVPILIPAPSPTLRPMVGVVVNGCAVLSVHAPSGNHNAAVGVVRSQLVQLTNQQSSFIVAGDFNSDVGQQACATVQALASPVPTHQSGGTLDGMVCSQSVNAMSIDPVTNHLSDHHVGLEGVFRP